ncbi:GGDEF domain-containing protein [Vibrio algarum]|uniref:diguanylate cyclase n=1 Tax=Vibrio algarum TaxID=3020714 RepID=A0ABT4YV05_9VIBR|nr:diguanylate cyclase [Vibrio sp. KJ40-1]MDB1124986.1 diguanylate cyclase [Vibrio sp. KJ40-1]
MDNFTLLATMFIVAGVNAVFTFASSKNAGETVSTEWRRSSILLLIAFSLILTQSSWPKFISIIIANYLLLLGFYFQIYTALCFEFKKMAESKPYLKIITIVYALSFLYFTYIDFHTTYRIIIISSLLALCYGYAVVKTRKNWKESKNLLRTKEVFYLFGVACLFYIGRTVVTIIEFGQVNSLFDKNTMTTVAFLFLIFFNLVFLMGMFNATIREKNVLINREKEKLNHLFDFLSDTAKHLKLEDLYPSIEKVLRKSFKVNTAAIFLKDEGENSHSMNYVFNDLDLPLDEVKHFNKGEGLSGKAMEENRVITIDIDTYPNRHVADAYKSMGVTNLVGIPLKTAEGVMGAITVVYSTDLKKQNVFNSELFYYLGEQIALVLQNALLYKKLTQLAETDSMTGLLNRRKMQEMFDLELKKAKRSNQSLTVAIIDLDNFKNVNDNYGHDCGDRVIKNAARVFQKECRETDYISRWGEEFLCLYASSDMSAGLLVTERVRKAFEKQSYPCLDKANVTISAGMAEYHEGMTMDQLIAQADKALYEAKRKGRNRIEQAVIENT